jgi:hypothetical protein
MARRVSQADRELSKTLAARDVDASPRKIESMRQAGLLEESQHPGLGRGRGSHSVRSSDEVDRAEYMAALLDECGSYADAVLVAFVRDNYPIAKNSLARPQAVPRSRGEMDQEAGRGEELRHRYRR